MTTPHERLLTDMARDLTAEPDAACRDCKQPIAYQLEDDDMPNTLCDSCRRVRVAAFWRKVGVR